MIKVIPSSSNTTLIYVHTWSNISKLFYIENMPSFHFIALIESAYRDIWYAFLLISAAVANSLTNGSAAFKWKLHWPQLRGLLQHHNAVVIRGPAPFYSSSVHSFLLAFTLRYKAPGYTENASIPTALPPSHTLTSWYSSKTTIRSSSRVSATCIWKISNEMWDWKVASHPSEHRHSWYCFDDPGIFAPPIKSHGSVMKTSFVKYVRRYWWNPKRFSKFMVVIIPILKYCEWIITHVDDGKFRIVIIIKYVFVCLRIILFCWRCLTLSVVPACNYP